MAVAPTPPLAWRNAPAATVSGTTATVTVAAAAESARLTPSLSVLRGAAALLLTQPATWLASLAVATLVPRYLGDRALGQYSLAATLITLASTLAAIGVSEYLPRRVATHPAQARTEAGSALLVVLVLGAVLAAGLALARPLLPVLLPAPAFYLMLAGMLVALVQRPLLGVLRGEERHGRFAWYLVISTVSTAVVGIAALAAGGGLTAFIAAGVTANLLVTLGLWRACRFAVSRAALGWPAFRNVLVAGAPFLVWNLALATYGEIDRVLLAALSGDAVVGWYAAAYRIISIPIFIPTLVMTPLLPALSRSLDAPTEFRTTLERSLLAVAILTIPVSALVVALAPAIPGALGWPDTFSRSVPLMMILAPHIPLVGVDMILGTALIALRRERKWLGVALAAALFNPALNVVLIPLFESRAGNGAIGAAVVTLATEVLMFFGALWLLPRGLFGWRALWRMGGALVAGIAAGLAASALLPTSPIVAAGAGVLVYVTLALASRTFSLADVRLLFRQVSRRAPGPRLGVPNTCVAAVSGRSRS